MWDSANNEEKFADYNTSGTNAATFSFSIGTAGSPNLTVNGVSADYTTTHVFVDEIAGDQIPITVFFDPGTAAVDASTRSRFTQTWTAATTRRWPTRIPSASPRRKASNRRAATWSARTTAITTRRTR